MKYLRYLCLTFIAAVATVAAPAMAAMTIQLDKVESRNLYGARENVVMTFRVQPGAVLRNIAWNLTATSMPGGLVGVGGISFTNSEGFGGYIMPSFPMYETGTFQRSGEEELFPETEILRDGILNVSFFNETNDVPGAEMIWTGTLRLAEVTLVGEVPEPASWMLMILAMGLTGGVLRRARGRTMVAAA